ncbi:AI-2E family transporter, partial [Patescibacteria group bacterium]|nr:AI-2E family transporter [Patescibacteria group bacterium]
MKEGNQTINLSIVSILKIIAVILLLLFVYMIRDVMAILFVAVIFGAAIDPWVDWLQTRKIPRILSILTIYVLSFGILALVVVLLVPAITTEFVGLTKDFPSYYQRIIGGFEEFQGEASTGQGVRHIIESWVANIGQTTRGIFSTISDIFGGFIALFAVLVITFYLIVEKDNMRAFLQAVTPLKYQPYVMQLHVRMQKKIGSWLRGQVILMIIIGILSYIGLLILGVKYALLLALFAGLMEIIPYIGPIFGAVPAVFIAFTQSPIKSLLVIVLYLIIQQLENNLIVPKIMKRAVGLNPIVVILVILIGGKIAGIVGALIAVPVA